MKKSLAAIFISLFLTLAPNVLAHNPPAPSSNVCPSGHNLVGNICQHASDLDTGAGGSTGFKFTLINPGFTNLGELIGILIQLVMFVAGIFFFAQILIAGIRWIAAGGDPKSVAAARDRVTNAVMGLVLIVGSYAIIKIIEVTLGIRILSGFTIR